MKAVLLHVSEQDLAERRQWGLDRYDESWEGVLHMSPAPSPEHQRIVEELLTFLRPLLRRKKRGTLKLAINVFNEASPKQDYRIPDFTFVAAGRERLIAADGVRGGGPDAVIEIRSPDDETYEKLPFFAALGVREVVVVDRDSKKPEVLRLTGSQYLVVAADREGWVASEVLGVRFRLLPGTPPRLAVEDIEDPSARVEI
ncbi:MAG: Uma2 family endonuclease [Planctomycetes bacterium]|nr:Uma2 family endonuclease [Planctomycetota bacterium]